MQKYGKKINSIQFTLSADASLEAQAHTMFQILGEIDPRKFKDGYTIQAGFTVYTCQEVPGGYAIFAPDYFNDPFHMMTDDLTQAFQIQHDQVQLLRSYNVEGVETRFDSKVVARKGVLAQSAIYLQRGRTDSPNDSGWYIGPRDRGTTPPDVGDLEAFYGYELVSKRSGLVKLLALPYDFLAVVDGDSIVAILNEQDESVEPLK